MFIISVHSSQGWFSLPALEDNEVFFDSYKEKYFCYIINPLLTKLAQSRWLDITLAVTPLYIFYGPRIGPYKSNTRPLSTHIDLIPGQ